ncbi:acyl carrier protein [Paenibacillus sp. IHBB 10380]|uniref:acyl carrier protein n=1 Tax=Paenibacillus sp. IHBB 10380 TaxID=1566358 RepID=UPI0005CFC882|nr:acyl carrier protein [Paenibacillus sp. IHBB 10380]
MEKNEIVILVANQVKELLQSEEQQITLETSIQELGLNSIAFIKLLVFLEDEFNIEFEDDDLLIEQYSTFEDMVNKICEKQNV